MGRLIDADKLLSYIADIQLSNAPDERDSEEVQKAQKEIYDMYEDFFEIVSAQPTAYDVDKVVEELHKNGCDYESLCNPNKVKCRVCEEWALRYEGGVTYRKVCIRKQNDE